MSRRGALKAGALAVGAAFLPRAGAAEAVPGGALEQLRAEYQGRIVALVDELEPQFRSRELRGFNDDDEHELDRDGHAWYEADEAARVAGGQGCSRREFMKYVPPAWKLENVCREHLASTDADTYLVLMCSSYRGATFSTGFTHPAFHAGAAAARDVLREAHRRGWYVPDATKDEHPTGEELAADADEPLPALDEVES